MTPIIELKSFTFIDLFAGIGGFHQAASELEGRCVFACEIDKYAREAYCANYNLMPHVWHENKAGNISSYPHSCALRAGASYNYLLNFCADRRKSLR